MEKINNDLRTDSEGRKYFFGEHYSLDIAKKLYKEEEWDNEEVMKINHCYVHFGFVYINWEKTNGWSVHHAKPKSMRGYKKATELLFKKDIELTNHIKNFKNGDN